LLAEPLKELIRARGPIPFRDWMEAALYDPVGGYYNRADLKRWGREADYRTSPERSGLFAATFARYFARLYEELGRPSRWNIIEGGAGDGSFAAGVLRSLARNFPHIFEATHYVLEEISPDALSRAQKNLTQFDERISLATKSVLNPSDPCLYFSNELLDAFPVHRLTSEGELYVTLDSGDNFAWTVGPHSTPRLAEHATHHLIDVNLAIDDWLASVAEIILCGYVITVDYGTEAPADTLRAFAKHGFVDDVLSSPGDYDITSSVNWAQVKATGERLGFQVVEFTSQNKFLLQAGLLEELELKLSKLHSDAEKLALTTEAREMILPGGMASSFQVLVQKRT
jgi:SAM-dependent MidA family methyltransferase